VSIIRHLNHHFGMQMRQRSKPPSLVSHASPKGKRPKANSQPFFSSQQQ